MDLKLLQCLKCQAAVVAAIFIDVPIRDRELLAFLQVAQVFLQGIWTLSVLARGFFPIWSLSSLLWWLDFLNGKLKVTFVCACAIF